MNGLHSLVPFIWGKETPCIQLMDLKVSLNISKVVKNIIIALSCNSWKSIHKSSSISPPITPNPAQNLTSQNAIMI